MYKDLRNRNKRRISTFFIRDVDSLKNPTIASLIIGTSIRENPKSTLVALSHTRKGVPPRRKVYRENCLRLSIKAIMNWKKYISRF